MHIDAGKQPSGLPPMYVMAYGLREELGLQIVSLLIPTSGVLVFVLTFGGLDENGRGRFHCSRRCLMSRHSLDHRCCRAWILRRWTYRCEGLIWHLYDLTSSEDGDFEAPSRSLPTTFYRQWRIKLGETRSLCYQKSMSLED